MMWQMIGSPPISTIGFGLMTVSSARRVPNPPARITAFMDKTPELLGDFDLRTMRQLSLEYNEKMLHD